MESPDRCDDSTGTMGVWVATHSCGAVICPVSSRIHLPMTAATRPLVAALEQASNVGSSGRSVSAWLQVHGPSGFIGQYPFG